MRSLAVISMLMWAVLACDSKPPRTETASGPPAPPSTTNTPVAIRSPVSRPSAAPLGETFNGWTATPGPQGRIDVHVQHAPIFTMRYVYFGPQWQWAGQRIEDLPATSEGGAGFRITTTQLPVTTTAISRKLDEHTLETSFDLSVDREMQGFSGIGMEFLLELDSAAWPKSPQPVISDDAHTLTIPLDEHEAFAIEVEGGSAKLYFERGQPHHVRLMFAMDELAKGHHTVKVRYRLPSSGRVMPPINERYGPVDPQTWHHDALVWDDWPVDLSFLNQDKPAGTHGMVEARGDALVFADGTPARFWGTNIAAYTLYTGSQQDVATQAKRIAALGFNLVRLHHHDSHWQRTNVFAPGNTTRTLDQNALERLDWWIKCLRDEGIYVWVDIHVGRQFRPGDDIPGYDELKRNRDGKGEGFNYVNDRIQTLMREFTQQYLIDRNNRYTQTRWVDDPAVIALLITNENDLTDHFGNMFAKDKGNRIHQALYEKQVHSIAATMGLSSRDALKPWAPGPSKVVLAEIQHRFDEQAIHQLRNAGIKQPIATTNYWGNNKLWSWVPLLGGDIIDAHSYGQAEALSANPRYAGNWVHFLAGAQAAGKPYSVTEWNVSSRFKDRFTAPTYVASIGALQGWDALMLYCYNQGPLGPQGGHHQFVNWIDPGIMALAPAAAVLFRRDVATANRTYVLRPDKDDLFGQPRNGFTSAAIRTAAEMSRLVVQMPEMKILPWARTTPVPDGEPIEDLDRDLLGPGTQQVVSDTGEIRRDWGRGVQTIDTSRSQVVSGWIGGMSLETSSATFAIQTPKATVAFTSLDGLPLDKSHRVLVSTGARAVPASNQGQQWMSEPVRGTIALKRSDPLKLTPLTARSRGTTTGKTSITGHPDGVWTRWTLPDQGSHWYIIESP